MGRNGSFSLRYIWIIIMVTAVCGCGILGPGACARRQVLSYKAGGEGHQARTAVAMLMLHNIYLFPELACS